MSNEPITTIVGNLTAEPELRFTPSGAAVANFTVASTPRTFDKNANEWKDGEPLFMRCSVWRDAAENVAESLHKGMRVIVQGRLVSRSWEDKDTGQKRTVVEMQVDEVGPSVRYATAQVAKVQRGQQQGGWGQQGGQQQAPQQGGGWGEPPQQQGAPQQGGWGQPAQQQGFNPGGGQQGGYDTAPPF